MPNPNNPCDREFIDEDAFVTHVRRTDRNGRIYCPQALRRALRQPGKSSMFKVLNDWEDYRAQQIASTKRHHRCYCGSGKLNKNCCK